MRHPAPDPPAEVAVRDGLAYALFLPDDPPAGGVVILHGAGSRKESHFDFARAARRMGLAAVAFDQRGHGASAGGLDGRLAEDVAAMAALLPAGPVALRGSSMGGYVALVSAQRVGAAAVVAICPAGAEGLLRGLRAGRFAFRARRPALDAFLAEHPLRPQDLTADLLLMHAEGDEQVPLAQSERLLEVAGSPRKRLVVQPGGHHRSVQHDEELQGLSLRWILRAFRAAPG